MRNSKSSPKSTNTKDILINESAVKEMIHTYCFQTRGAAIKKTATISLRQLLLRAGDIEMNPGPKYRPTTEYREQDSDRLLKTVAKQIHKEVDIDSLGVELGFEHSEIHRYMQANRIDHTVTYMGTLNMLRDWRKNTKRSEEREKLKKALIAIDHLRLADDLLNDDMARITDSSLGNIVFVSPRPSPSTSDAIHFQYASAAAGEVCTARVSDTVSDGKLNTLAAHIPHMKYEELSVGLGMEYNEASRILKEHGNDYKRAMRECLSIWKNKSGGSFTELKRIFDSVHFGGIWRQYME